MIGSVRSSFAALGATMLAAIEELGRMGIFFAITARQALRPPWEFRLTLEQIRFVGARSMFVIACVNSQMDGQVN